MAETLVPISLPRFMLHRLVYFMLNFLLSCLTFTQILFLELNNANANANAANEQVNFFDF